MPPRTFAVTRRAGALVLLLGAALAGLAALTLGPLPMRAFERVVALLGVLTPGEGGPSRGAVERVGNVLLFLPLGLLLALLAARARPWLLVVALAALSLAVEVAQSTLLPDRYPTPRDVALNTLGAAVGVLAGRGLLRLRRRRA